jgi:RHS repeat-associated protein
LTKFIGGTTDIYIYDGDGQRVKKNASGVTLYWYGATGNVLDETSSTGTLVSEYIFFNGKRVARRDADNSVKYYFSDNLGSASVITNSSGTIIEESDYYPYGGEIPITSGDPNHYKFTGKERDTESGLDNFGARYDSSSLGRFMTPDWAAKATSVPYATFGDPQTLNLYAYVENSPLNRVDADGHDPGYSEGPYQPGESILEGENRYIEQYIARTSAAKGINANQTQAQNQGEGSQANLNRRDAIASNAVDAKQRADLGQKTYGPNQCSAFVSACITKAGAEAKFTPDDGPPRPPVAGEWANKKADIPGWRVLGPNEKPAPGDVAAVHIQNPHFAATGDSAIVVRRGNGLSAIQAGDHGVEYNSNFIHGYSGVVYRRYTGD